MPHEAFIQFELAMDPIRAEEALTDIVISAYPHMKKDKQTNFHRKYYKIAYPNLFNEDETGGPPKMTTRQFAQMLAGRK